jgi:hypothetical protein
VTGTPLPVSEPMTGEQMAGYLAREQGMHPDRAGRVVAIARANGLKAEPVPGGYLEIRAERQPDGSYWYTLTARTGPRA